MPQKNTTLGMVGRALNYLPDLFRRGNPFNNPEYGFTQNNVEAFLDAFGSNLSDSGEAVTPITAMQTSTVWACIKLISEQISTTPLCLYQFDGKGGKHIAVQHDYFDIIASQPNEEQDAIAFRTAVMTNILLHGNGYIEIQRDKGGRVRQLWNRAATRTQSERLRNGQLVYVTSDSYQGTDRVIDPDNIVHLMGNTFDGYVGLSPIAYARQSIGGNLAMDKFGARFFANFAMPQMALLTKQKVKPEDKQKMRTDWESLQSGTNQHRVAILDQELDIKTLSIPPEDAQFLETKQATKRDIATMYSVPLQKLNDFEKGVKATSEQQDTDFYNVCLKPWMSKWEMGLTNKLFNSLGRSAGRYVVRYNISNLIRPDALSRQTFYQSMIQNGVFCQNEVREMEGFNPIPDGDGHYLQLNMQSLAMANSTDPEPNEPDEELGAELQANSYVGNVEKVFRSTFNDGMVRLSKRNTRNEQAVRQCLGPVLFSMAAMFSSSSEPPKVEDETYKAVCKLFEGIEHRASKWSDVDLEQASKEELRRAVRSLIHAANRQAAHEKSLKEIEQLEQTE